MQVICVHCALRPMCSSPAAAEDGLRIPPIHYVPTPPNFRLGDINVRYVLPAALQYCRGGVSFESSGVHFIAAYVMEKEIC